MAITGITPALYQKDTPQDWWEYVPLEELEDSLRNYWLIEWRSNIVDDVRWLMACLSIGVWPKRHLDPEIRNRFSARSNL